MEVSCVKELRVKELCAIVDEGACEKFMQKCCMWKGCV